LTTFATGDLSSTGGSPVHGAWDARLIVWVLMKTRARNRTRRYSPETMVSDCQRSLTPAWELHETVIGMSN